VVFYHNFGFSNYFFFGWLGVDLFFVLSGFLITDILLKTKNSPGYLKNFYGRRVLRIFPLYYLSLFIFLIVLPRTDGFPIDLSYYINNQWWFWAYLQNWFLIFFDAGNTTTMIQHYWSLAVEEQFYIIWPFVILLIRKPGRFLVFTSLLLLGVISARFIIWQMHVKEFNYFGLYTYTRIDGLCIGSMLAVLMKINSSFLRKYSSVVVFTLAGFNFLFYFFNRRHEFSFPYLAIIGYTTFAIVFALVVYEAVARENKIINFILGIRLLRFFGKISYGLYVFHWPVYLILYKYADNWIHKNLAIADQYAQTSTSIALTLTGIAVSIISFYGFEKHFLKMKKLFA